MRFSLQSAVLAALVLASSYGLAGWARSRALAHGLLDHPNERSSHSVATPRGAGVGIAVAVEFTLLVLREPGDGSAGVAAALFVAGALVAMVGYLDDRFGLSAGVRLAVHVAAACLVLAVLPLSDIPVPGGFLPLGGVGRVIALLAIVWSINLFNFMDGIDGLAGSQAVFVFAAAALLSWSFGGSEGQISFLLSAAAASLGFLAWNWPPARVFMGDVGSGYLGLLVAVSAFGFAGTGPLTPWTWVVLHAVFVGDSTVTILVRARRGERLQAAHRSHLYQRLSRFWGSHRRTVIMTQLYNLAVVLPMAVVTIRYPEAGALAAGLVLAPVAATALWVGAGQPDGVGRIGST